MSEMICPTFSKQATGEVSISGLGEGVMYVSEDILPLLLSMSVDGKLYPYQIMTACIRREMPSEWLCVITQLK